MLNYKSNLKISKIAIIVLFLFMVTGGTWSKTVKNDIDLADRVIKINGDDKLVSVYDYFQAIMDQVGGNIAIQSRDHHDIRQIKLQRNFVKGQNVKELLHKFCLVYRGFDYKISESVVNIYYDKSVKLKSSALADYSFGKGSFYLSLDFPGSGAAYGSKLPHVSASLEVNPEFGGASISGEYFLGSRFAIALGLLFTGFNVAAAPDEYQTYLTIDPRVTYHYTFLGIHSYLGLGIGYTVQYGDKGSEVLYAEEGKKFAGSFFLTMRAGALFRLYKRMHLKFELVFVRPLSSMPRLILGFTYKW